MNSLDRTNNNNTNVADGTFNYNSSSLPVLSLSPLTLIMPSPISLGATTHNRTYMQMWGQGRPRGKSFGMQIEIFYHSSIVH